MAELTERDRKVLVMAWQCFKDKPEVDYKKLAEMKGYKTAASATTAYHGVKTKLLGEKAAALRDRDREILVAVWSCFKAVPQVDYHKLKEMGGYKTAASATTAFHSVKTKLCGASAETKGTPKRKRAGDDRVEKTPASKKRAKKITNKIDGEGKLPLLGKDSKSGDVTAMTSTSPGHRPETSAEPDQDGDKVSIIKEEPRDDFVHGSLSAGAAKLLVDEESDSEALN